MTNENYAKRRAVAFFFVVLLLILMFSGALRADAQSFSTPTPSGTVYPTITPYVFSTSESMTFDCPASFPVGWGTATPNALWLDFCGHCLPTATPTSLVTQTPGPTSTPFTYTPSPGFVRYVNSGFYGTDGVVQNAICNSYQNGIKCDVAGRIERPAPYSVKTFLYELVFDVEGVSSAYFRVDSYFPAGTAFGYYGPTIEFYYNTVAYDSGYPLATGYAPAYPIAQYQTTLGRIDASTYVVRFIFHNGYDVADFSEWHFTFYLLPQPVILIDENSYCSVVNGPEGSQDIDIGWTGIQFGEYQCIDIGGFRILDFDIPYLGRLCIQQVYFGSLNLFGVNVSFDFILSSLVFIALFRLLITS